MKQKMGHFFTPEEANKKLPEVRKLVSDIAELDKKLGRRAFTSEKDRRSALDRISIIISKLAELGIELKDPDTGLVDFPAMRFNEPVYLCWRLGEEEVLYWHGIQEGFRGRKLLRPEPTQVR
ncbi:MAG: DUF2203 domain-containing protein [Nitrososphaerales archaeon]